MLIKSILNITTNICIYLTKNVVDNDRTYTLRCDNVYLTCVLIDKYMMYIHIHFKQFKRLI